LQDPFFNFCLERAGGVDLDDDTAFQVQVNDWAKLFLETEGILSSVYLEKFTTLPITHACCTQCFVFPTNRSSFSRPRQCAGMIH
jgi:hypothetical protein